MRTNQIVEHLKSANNDFEFYPTTDEIIGCIAKHIKYSLPRQDSILDVGAGNGATLMKLAENSTFNHKMKMLAIEKSSMLRALYTDTKINVVGTDFYQANLWNKEANIIFSNPPYSEFVKWSVKIINEARPETHVFLVIPQRWKDSTEIKSALDARKLTAQVLNSYDFLDGERKARAYIDVVYIQVNKSKTSFLFNEISKIFDSDTATNKNHYHSEDLKNKTGDLVGGDYVQMLVQFYNEDVDKLKNSLFSLSKLDADVLNDFGLSVGNICSILREKINGMGKVYWHLLVEKFQPLTCRLISTFKNELLERVFVANLDFTASNIHAVVEQMILLTNKTLDEQVVSVYDKLAYKSNVEAYKSNQELFKNNRWDRNTPSKLTYRLVASWLGKIESWSGNKSINYEGKAFLQDVIIIAENFGYKCHEYKKEGIKYSEKCYIKADYKGKEVILLEFKFYQNNNMHLKFHQEFMHKMNIIKGRLSGWLKTPQDVVNEMDDIKPEQAQEFWGGSNKVTKSMLLLN